MAILADRGYGICVRGGSRDRWPMGVELWLIFPNENLKIVHSENASKLLNNWHKNREFLQEKKR